MRLYLNRFCNGICANCCDTRVDVTKKGRQPPKNFCIGTGLHVGLKLDRGCFKILIGGVVVSTKNSQLRLYLSRFCYGICANCCDTRVDVTKKGRQHPKKSCIGTGLHVGLKLDRGCFKILIGGVVVST